MTVPLAWRVVVLIKNISSTKDMAEDPTIVIRVEVVFLNEFLDAVRPHKVIRVIKVNLLKCYSISSYGITVIGNPLSNPVVTSDDFHIPYIFFVAEYNTVSFSRTVFGD